MVKVFLSQPMLGKSFEEIEKARQCLIDHLPEILGEEVDFIDSHFDEEFIADKKPLWCLGKAFELMSEADVVVFMDGWDQARGCKLEHAAAEAYGYKTMHIRREDIE